MTSAERTGRLVGVLLVFQLAGLIVPFVLLLPLTPGPEGYLPNAVGAARQIRVAVVLLLGNGALTIGITIAAFRVIRQWSGRMALGLLAASVIMLVLQAVDNIHILSMVSLSTQYAQAGGPNELFQALAAVVGATRRWAHVTELLAIDCWILLLYSILYRVALVPRAVAVFGLITVLLHLTGIPLRALAGYGSVGWMAMPMALSHITLAVWLISNGFRNPAPPIQASAIAGC